MSRRVFVSRLSDAAEMIQYGSDAGSDPDEVQYQRLSSVSQDEAPMEPTLTARRRMRTVLCAKDIVAEIDQQDTPLEGASLRDRVKILLESTFFQACMASCIMVNAAVIGGETDYPDLEIWSLVENIFLIIFSAELFLRMLSVGICDFFARGGDQLWNLFDFSIVGLGIFDFACEILGAENKHPRHHSGNSKNKGGGGVTTLFRMIRLLRILRVFKIVRFLKQLYMIFFGFVEAIQAICLVSVLMFFVLYLCSVVMVRTYGRIPSGDEKAMVVANQFKSIKTAMLSLFELMSNPGNLEIYHGSFDAFPILTLFLIAFVIFGSFGMIALLTGVISESMFEKNQTRVQELRQEREQKREKLKDKCVKLFDLVEKDDLERARPGDLDIILPHVREIFEQLDIEFVESEFEVILSKSDLNQDEKITETEFVSGIMSLCDGVRAASLLELYYMLSDTRDKVTGIQYTMEHDFQELFKRAIPSMQADIKKIMDCLMQLDQKGNRSLEHNLERQSQIGTPSFGDERPPSNGLDSSGLTHLAESQLGDIKVSAIARKMDEHALLISQKIDDLNTELIPKKIDELMDSIQALVHGAGHQSFAQQSHDDLSKSNAEMISRKLDDLRAIIQDLVNGQVFTLQEAQVTETFPREEEPEAQISAGSLTLPKQTAEQQSPEQLESKTDFENVAEVQSNAVPYNVSPPQHRSAAIAGTRMLLHGSSTNPRQLLASLSTPDGTVGSAPPAGVIVRPSADH